MISREDLANYRLLEDAITNCEKRIIQLDNEEHPMVTDKVRGSNVESPYEMRSYMIKGIDPEWKVKHMQRKLSEERELLRLKSLQWDIEELIASVKNVRHKMVLEYTAQGKNQESIAWKLEMTQANVSLILKKYTSAL